MSFSVFLRIRNEGQRIRLILPYFRKTLFFPVLNRIFEVTRKKHKFSKKGHFVPIVSIGGTIWAGKCPKLRKSRVPDPQSHHGLFRQDSIFQKRVLEAKYNSIHLRASKIFQESKKMTGF